MTRSRSEPGDAPRLPLAWFGLFARRVPAAPPLPPESGQADHRARPDAGSWGRDVDEGITCRGVSRIREEIAAGNVYLVNLTTRFHRTGNRRRTFDLYCRLVGSYASGYHAYLETPDWAVACGSPELFFEWSRTDIVTRP